MRIPFARSVFLPLLTASTLAVAADAPPQGVVSLSSQASVEVAKDMLSLTLSTSRDGNDAAAVQAGLKQVLEAALTEARKVAKPGLIDVQTGQFSLMPRHAPKTGAISGWQGSAELLIEGRDVAGIAQLAGRINGLSVARVSANLSREQREKVESELAAQAIAGYRAKAENYARQFGYSGFVVREVAVDTQSQTPRMAPMMAMAKADMATSEALPVELGRGLVTVQVNGTIQLTK